MIPLRLRVSGFLSYKEPAELDFTGFELACISGPNGAGKSTLLDAITWALFGQARKRDDSLINLQSQAAEVAFTFQYEGNEYRVLRSMTRGKTPVLELQVRQPSQSHEPRDPTSDSQPAAPEIWRPLTERTLRETQSRIEQILRLEYDTFVNSSFFLQGKADQFTQQSPSRRKDVLRSILGMEAWESYKNRAAELRRVLEGELSSVEGRLGEIQAEVGEAEPRRQRLMELETELQRLTAARTSQESVLENVRKLRASLDKQRALIDALAAALGQSRLHLAALENRLVDRQAARAVNADLTLRAPQIESAYQAWRENLQGLEAWEKTASAFREHEVGRQPLLQKIAAEGARLEEEQRQLLLRQQEIEAQVPAVRELETQMGELRRLLAEADARVAERDRLEKEYSSARETIASLKAENEGLKLEMDTLKSRIETLKSASGPTCPLCGQALSPKHRKSTVKALQAEGTQRGDSFRSNKAAIAKFEVGTRHLESQLSRLASAQAEKLDHTQSMAQLGERLAAAQSLRREWESTGSKRLKAVVRLLEKGTYAAEARAELARVDRQLARLGYDAAAHDQARSAELEQRSADEDHRRLEAARAALAPLDNEVQNLGSEIANRKAEIARQENELQKAQPALEAGEASLPDMAAAESGLLDLQERENQLHQEVGAARQRVAVLEDLRARNRELESERQLLALNIGRHKVLERAFGKDGVPALLIEQALPEIETKANEVLDRLSDGQMSVRFLTQAGYKDRKREDLRETLDIQISDGAGARDYETYSGGEAFRVNFAVRLALSEVLAGRKGARLQTLVIDEGFGSQDNQGRQRLIEAINMVRSDFAKILLITHLDELKDSFPTRIEVEKTEQGSIVRVT